ncbi:MAG: DUF975 family protein [Lachnospiraceae bacterium]|jgi:uncharacterized membrane protein|nr:DUF975 family protein [Lachnospiraceae bacterium]
MVIIMHRQSYRSSAMLKTMAKGQLLGKYPIVTATVLLVVMISFIVRIGVLGFIDQSSLGRLLLYTAAHFILMLLLGVINAGASFMALKICCNEPLRISDIFYAFSYQPEKIVTVLFVSNGIVLLSSLPYTLFQFFYAQTGQSVYLILSAIALLVSIGISCHVLLILSQAIFLLLDFTDRPPLDIMRMSATLMRGHKGRLFYLWISFLPLALLSLLTCCIGFIWVIPYFKVTLANFYMDLTQKQQ